MMLKDNEVFSFDLKSLTTDAEEKNFEMLKAEYWYKQQRPPEDRAFDEMVALVSDPYEVCFEMNHMVQYVKSKVHRTIFESWNPPHVFAEFWIQKQAQLLLLRSEPKIKSLTRSAVQYQSIQPEKPKVDHVPKSVSTTINTTVAHSEPQSVRSSSTTTAVHRAIPGFQSILQCGSTTLCGDTTFMGSVPVSSFTVTPTTARINRLFQESTAAFTRYEMQDENNSTIGVDTTTTATTAATPSTERINHLFQDTITSMGFLKPHTHSKALSEDAENEPPVLTIATDHEDEGTINQSLAFDNRMDCGGGVTSSSTVAAHAPSVTSTAGGDFSIFYDPFGLETGTQPPVTERIAQHPSEKRRPLLPTPVLVNSTASEEPISFPDAQIFSRDPRLRSKKVDTPATTTTVATPTTEHINHLFQDTTASMSFLKPNDHPTTRSEDVENEPPVLTIASDHEEKATTDQSLALDSRMDCSGAVTLSGTAKVPTPSVTSTAGGDFSIFYDPFGLETGTQPPVTERIAQQQTEKRRPLLPTPVLVNSTASEEPISFPEAQIFSRDPRLRSKKVVPNADPVYESHSPLPTSSAPFSATMFVDRLERTSTTLGVDDTVSCAMNSPTAFFRHLLGLNAAQDPDGTT